MAEKGIDIFKRIVFIIKWQFIMKGRIKMFEWEDRKSCGDLFLESHNATPYKINWNNKEFGKVWFTTSLNVPRNYSDYCMIMMGVEGMVRGWKMDLSKFNLEGCFVPEGYVTIEEGNEIVASLKKYFRENIYINDSRISQKDIDKFVKLSELFWENPYTRQRKRDYLHNSDLDFLDK